MKQVSEVYKESMARPLRNQSHVRVLFNNNDTTIPSDGRWVGNGELSMSNTDTLDYNRLYGAPYATLELNLWTLDGSFEIQPDENPDAGFVSSILSDNAGNTTEPVVLTREFSKSHTIPMLSFSFDTRTLVSPKTVSAEFYLNGNLVKQVESSVSGDSVAITTDVAECDSIVVRFGELPPYRYARLEGVTYGVQKMFAGNVIESTKQSHDVDPLSRRLPKETMQFTLLDYDRQYDPDNPSGVWKYVAENSIVAIQLGYEIKDGAIEWLKPDSYILDSRPSFSNNRAIFKATGYINRLSGTYYKGVFGERSFYDLAEDVLLDAKLPPLPDGSNPWFIDESLKTMYTTAALPIETHANCLQMIAHACCCTLRTDDENIIRIERFSIPSSSDYDLRLDFSSISQNSQTMAKIEQLKAVTVAKNMYMPEDSAVLYSDTTDDTTLHVEFSSPATDISIYVSGGTVFSSNLYANAADLVLSEGTKVVSISGKPVSQSTVVYTFPSSRSGSIDEEKNPLITNNEMCVALANHVSKYLQLRNTYDFSYRGNPELECGDMILFQTMYTKKAYGLVLADEITFRGSIQGKTKLKSIDIVIGSVDVLGAFILGQSLLGEAGG